MSEEKISELESLLRRMIGLGWASLLGVVAAAFAFGGWAASLELRAQDSSARLTNATRISLEAQSELNNHDKRVTRVEDSVLSINKSLDRIEGKLGTK